MRAVPSNLARPAAVLLAVLGALAGCAHSPETPREAAQGWSDAVREGDVQAALELSSPDLVGDMDLATMQAGLGDGVASEARYLIDVRTDEGAVTVAVGADGGLIATEVVPPLAGTTPEGAARVFLRALESGRPGLLLTVMPAERATGGEAAAQLVLASEATADLVSGGAARALRAALRERAHSEGEGRAWIAGDGWRMTLVREPGGWKVDDVRREE